MKKQLYRAAAATVLGLSLTSGVAAADSTSSNIHTTGPGSRNTITSRHINRAHVHNDNHVTVRNDNYQSGYTGDAYVNHNTTGGDATTGTVENDNATSAKVYMDNSASASNLAVSADGGQAGSASISNTGPHSSNEVESKVINEVTITNDNRLNVQNTNNQTGTSGHAVVSGNTTGGDATSGSVYNTNSSSFVLTVTN